MPKIVGVSAVGHLIYVSVDRLYQRPSLFVRHYLVMFRAPMGIDSIPRYPEIHDDRQDTV
jgi:hypothetical protein